MARGGGGTHVKQEKKSSPNKKENTKSSDLNRKDDGPRMAVQSMKRTGYFKGQFKLQVRRLPHIFYNNMALNFLSIVKKIG